MCLYYAIIIWIRSGGKLVIVFQPFPHVIVCTKLGVIHATNTKSSDGRWEIKRLNTKKMIKWLNL